MAPTSSRAQRGLESDLEFVSERLLGLEMLIEELLPALIAGSSERSTLEAQLQAWAQEDSNSVDDPARHQMLMLAETVLAALQAR